MRLVNPACRGFLRSLLREGPGATGRHAETLDRLGWTGFAELTGAAFELAVGVRFDPDCTIAEVIGFVGETRTRFDRTGADLDPRAAEELILATRGATGRAGTVLPELLVLTELVLLYRMVEEEPPTDAQLERLLDLAEARAARWLARAAATSWAWC